MTNFLYFFAAHYFAVFAQLVLFRWHPRIIAITGSAGKSTAVDLIADILSTKYTVRKSYKSNSAIGVPLDILNIHPKRFTKWEWTYIIVYSFFQAIGLLIAPHKAAIFIVELDSDRPGEMPFFSSFIHPEITYLVSSYATHTQNFDHLVNKGLFDTPKQAVANEFLSIIGNNKNTPLILVNGDIPNELIDNSGLPEKTKFIRDTKGSINFSHWSLEKNKTLFMVTVDRNKYSYSLPYLSSRVIGYTLVALTIIATYFNLDESEIQKALTNTTLPAGRSSVFDGVNGSILIDSTYNSSYYATVSMLEVLATYPGKRKIAVLGDMRELGKMAREEHENLAKDILNAGINQVVIVGPHMKEFTLPFLLSNGMKENNVHSFENTYQAGVFIKERLIQKGDIVLLKASQNTLLFEIIAEMLLENKADVAQLCRREPLWEEKRQKIIKDFYKSI